MSSWCSVASTRTGATVASLRLSSRKKIRGTPGTSSGKTTFSTKTYTSTSPVNSPWEKYGPFSGNTLQITYLFRIPFADFMNKLDLYDEDFTESKAHVKYVSCISSH